MKVRWAALGIVFAISCAAAHSTTPQANDAETVFKKMEAALGEAKTYQVDFESSTDGSTVRGTFKVDEGNKFEMKIDGAAGVKKFTLSLICDGKEFELTRTESPPPPVPLEPMPKLAAQSNLTANVAAALARGGAWLAQDFADSEYRMIADAYFVERQKAKEENNRPMKPVTVEARDVRTGHTLSNFRAGKAEKGASSVTYDLIRTGEKQVLITTFTVWIDAKGFPTRREGVFSVSRDGKSVGPPLSKWVETYTFR